METREPDPDRGPPPEPVPDAESQPVRATTEGADFKLMRAAEHFNTLKDQIEDYLSYEEHTISYRDDPEAAAYVFTVQRPTDTFADWGLIAGDCIHNARSALDHLVLQLAILGQDGRRLSKREEWACTFPITDEAHNFQPWRISLLRDEDQERITQLQPFNAWDYSIWGPSYDNFPDEYRMDQAWVPVMLQRLRDLDDTDKHRSIHATWAAADWIRAEPPPIPLLGTNTYVGPFEDGAEVGRWQYEQPRPELPADFDPRKHFPVAIGLGEPPLMVSALDLLSRMLSAVSLILDVFRPAIDNGAPPKPLPPSTHKIGSTEEEPDA